MSTDDPQLGETWSLGDQEGVIYARGPEAVRLVARSGRRATMPIRSLKLLWKLKHDAPIFHGCSTCGPATHAVLRMRTEGVLGWYCVDHVLAGEAIFFPGDNPDEEPPTVERTPQLDCPTCMFTVLGSTDSKGAVKSGVLDDLPVFIHSCYGCHSRWVILHSPNEGDDGQWFANNIPKAVDILHEDQQGRTTVYVGFTAINSLRRTVGFPRGEHLEGQRLIENDLFGGNTAVVVFHPDQKAVPETLVQPALNTFWRLRSSGYVTAVTSTTRDTVTLEPRHNRGLLAIDDRTAYTLELSNFYRDYEEVKQLAPPNPFSLGSRWRQLNRNNFSPIRCVITKVTSATVPVIHYIVDADVSEPDDTAKNMSRGSMSAPHFEEHWVPCKDSSKASKDVYKDLEPTADSFWRHRTTSEVVRVLPAPEARDLVRYVKINGTIEATSLMAFLRNYLLLPSPVRGRWYKDGIFYRPLSLQGQNYGEATVCLETAQGTTREVQLLELLATYEPVYFSAVSDNYPNLPLTRRTVWTEKTSGKAAEIYDFGTVTDKEIIRIVEDGVIQTTLLDENFFQRYAPPEPPCEVGEEWIREQQIAVVSKLDLRSLTVLLTSTLPDGTTKVTDLTFKTFQKHYKKLERRTLLDLISEEDS